MEDNRPERMPPSEPSGPARKRRPARYEAARTFASVGTVGLSFVLAVAMGTAVGLWLDRLTGWSPVFFLVFFVAGVAAGILNVYRVFTRLPK
jgi:F0F1-type ATP synthase assembly protein I